MMIKIKQFLLVLLLSGSLQLPVFSQQPAATQSNMEQLEIEVVPFQKEWTLGKPVYFYLKIHNKAPYQDEAGDFYNRTVFKSNLNLNSDIELYIQYETFPPLRYALEDWSNIVNFPQVEINIPYGRTWTFIFPICYDWKYASGYALNLPGTYHINGVIHLRSDNDAYRTVIPTIELKVNPVSEKDQTIWRYLDYPEIAKALSTSTLESDETARMLEDLLKRHPDSVYTVDLLYTLAYWHLTRKAYAQSLDYLNRALQLNDEAFPLEHLLYFKALALEAIGEVHQLYQVLWKLWQTNMDIYLVDSKNPLYFQFFNLQRKSEDKPAPWNLLE